MSELNDNSVAIPVDGTAHGNSDTKATTISDEGYRSNFTPINSAANNEVCKPMKHHLHRIFECSNSSCTIAICGMIQVPDLVRSFLDVVDRLHTITKSKLQRYALLSYVRKISRLFLCYSSIE